MLLQQDNEGSLRGLVRQLSIDQFENEGRRVDPESSAKHDRTPFFERPSMDPGDVHKVRIPQSAMKLGPLRARLSSGVMEYQSPPMILHDTLRRMHVNSIGKGSTSW